MFQQRFDLTESNRNVYTAIMCESQCVSVYAVFVLAHVFIMGYFRLSERERMSKREEKIGNIIILDANACGKSSNRFASAIYERLKTK